MSADYHAMPMATAFVIGIVTVRLLWLVPCAFVRLPWLVPCALWLGARCNHRLQAVRQALLYRVSAMLAVGVSGYHRVMLPITSADTNIAWHAYFIKKMSKIPSKWENVAHNGLICFFQHNYIPTFEQWLYLWDRVCVLSTWFGDICGSRN